MKISRKKRLQRYLNFFCNNYGFRRPFQVLIDGTICHAALKNKVTIKEQFPDYLEGELKLLTTQCVVIETEKLGGIVYGAMVIIKQFAIHKCGHVKPIGASACLKSMLGSENTSRYILATQDRELQNLARTVPGTPLLYLHGRTPTLEQPSEMSVQTATLRSTGTFTLNEHQKETLGQLKTAHGLEEPGGFVKKRKKKGGPNPLSCKKKMKPNRADISKKKASSNGETELRRIRKRKRGKTKRLE